MVETADDGPVGVVLDLYSGDTRLFYENIDHSSFGTGFGWKSFGIALLI